MSAKEKLASKECIGSPSNDESFGCDVPSDSHKESYFQYSKKSGIHYCMKCETLVWGVCRDCTTPSNLLLNIDFDFYRSK